MLEQIWRSLDAPGSTGFSRHWCWGIQLLSCGTEEKQRPNVHNPHRGYLAQQDLRIPLWGIPRKDGQELFSHQSVREVCWCSGKARLGRKELLCEFWHRCDSLGSCARAAAAALQCPQRVCPQCPQRIFPQCPQLVWPEDSNSHFDYESFSNKTLLSLEFVSISWNIIFVSNSLNFRN